MIYNPGGVAKCHTLTQGLPLACRHHPLGKCRHGLQTDNRQPHDSRHHDEKVYNCCAGLIYWVDVIMGFVTGFVVIYNLRRRVIREPMSIAEYYVRYGTFLPDFLASLPTIAEVCSAH